MPAHPELGDLYRLSDQLERDRDLAVDVLKQRDHAIGRDCQSADAGERLLFWLDRVAPVSEEDRKRSFHGQLGLNLARLFVFVAGFAAMAGFLLGSRQGLVNVFFLLLVFVFLQLAMSAVSTITLIRTLSGFVPAGLPASPVRWVAERGLPDRRYLREAGGVLRLMFLRYGQEWGALFTLAALLAFVLVPAFTDFVFVWGSTFNPGDRAVQGLVDALAAPWGSWLPWATVPPEVVAGSRHHAALVLDRAGLEDMRGWWAFLFLCLLVYALLPRLLLWLAARATAPGMLRRSLVGLPGADLVLSRMSAQLVSTRSVQASEDELATVRPADVNAAPAAPEGLLLVDWACALGDTPPARFEELPAVDESDILALGQGTLAEDRRELAALDVAVIEHLLVAVKSWEPPVAELADLLASLPASLRCTVCLVPLPGKAIPHRKVEDWRGFARGLPFAAVDLRLLNWVTAP
ncbi:DUF2868 domain-containing protein [Parahaliea aestuarii]|uniref:DUF2868 domain-containing protein n=1 Tax=Parahaliea aestuarii TaxID=1852021 RepID=A0A5C9A0Y3_9GAMM|nr:DUF2868 domain-containing protein [Parahaliea aestuarii]TXS93257.1 DUF2868 domain-containing protein [Parahaliea aestuarii]